MTQTEACVRAQILVSGHVQGVGYRAFARRMAASRGVTGGVKNLDSGQVALDAEGPRDVLEELLADLKKGPVGAKVSHVQTEWSPATCRHHDFTIWY
ncbi:MAG: acylphosphatase [Nitrospirota bacterium]|nr:acylphosphatase [Nitrospirota bacterium]